jgi:hypothetical protein
MTLKSIFSHYGHRMAEMSLDELQDSHGNLLFREGRDPESAILIVAKVQRLMAFQTENVATVSHVTSAMFTLVGRKLPQQMPNSTVCDYSAKRDGSMHFTQSAPADPCEAFGYLRIRETIHVPEPSIAEFS